MGPDDRAIREYVTTRSRELRRNRSLRNIYYLIVSGRFADDFDDTVRSVKMETEVNEAVLLEADTLVAIVDARLRNPREVTLGPDGIQRLFSSNGILSAGDVSLRNLGSRGRTRSPVRRPPICCSACAGV
jgi:hypothetical protein